MTSANVVEYTIFLKGKTVGIHRQHLLCKDKSRELLRFTPLEDHTIQEHWLDEEEAYHKSPPKPLLDFLGKYIWFQKEKAR